MRTGELMDTEMSGINEANEVAERHPDALARRMLHAFALGVETAGGKVSRARVDGYEAPEVNEGTISNHRFDLFGRWDGDAHVLNMHPGWFAADVVVDARRITPMMVNRWGLFESRARLTRQPIYYLVPDVKTQKRLEAVLVVKGISYTRVIVVEAV